MTRRHAQWLIVTKKNSSLTQTTNPKSSNPAMNPTANAGTWQPGTNPTNPARPTQTPPNKTPSANGLPSQVTIPA